MDSHLDMISLGHLYMWHLLQGSWGVGGVTPVATICTKLNYLFLGVGPQVAAARIQTPLFNEGTPPFFSVAVAHGGATAGGSGMLGLQSWSPLDFNPASTRVTCQPQWHTGVSLWLQSWSMYLIRYPARPPPPILLLVTEHLTFSLDCFL